MYDERTMWVWEWTRIESGMVIGHLHDGYYWWYTGWGMGAPRENFHLKATWGKVASDEQS